MTRAPQMIGEICPMCFRPHGAPVCGHDPDAPCNVCGMTVGLLWDDADGATCWFCVLGYPRPGPKPVYPPRPDGEFDL